MAARIYSQFPEKKIGAAPKASQSSGGTKPSRWNGKERTVDWKPAGKPWGSSFNRSTKNDVVKQYAKKQGID